MDRDDPEEAAEGIAEREEREAKLLAGVRSPTSEMTDEDWAVLRDTILSRNPELRDEL